jgi:3-oxoacid CoA-transferase B subunit
MTLTREGIAYRLAQDLPEGSYVSLGAGIPTMVTTHMPAGRELFIHSENGVLGIGPLAKPGEQDPDLTNSTSEYVTLLPGGSVFDLGLSFTMIRGGHITHAVTDAFQVAANGDLANWRPPGQLWPDVGGAMDLGFGVKQVWVAMIHVTNRGEPKIVPTISRPLTAPRCVRRIYTEMALIDVTPAGLVLRELAPGILVDEVRTKTAATLTVANDCKAMEIPASTVDFSLIAYD